MDLEVGRFAPSPSGRMHLGNLLCALLAQLSARQNGGRVILRIEDLAVSCGDFLLRRSDGLYAYQLAVVVDGAAMGVTQVVRGADMLPSTPRQLLLYRLLDLRPPRFIHFLLLLNVDGRRLSKQDGTLGIEALWGRFELKKIFGKLAFLVGMNPTAVPRMPESLLKNFLWERISTGNITMPEDLF